MVGKSEDAIQAVTEYLSGQKIEFDLIEHRQTFAADREARIAGLQPERAAKTLLLHGEHGYELAVIPASERLDLHKVRSLFNETHKLRLATESEIANEVGYLELGAYPPIGPLVNAREVIDARLLDYNRILCNAGDTRHSLVLDPADLVRATDSQVADICQD